MDPSLGFFYPWPAVLALCPGVPECLVRGPFFEANFRSRVLYRPQERQLPALLCTLCTLEGVHDILWFSFVFHPSPGLVS